METLIVDRARLACHNPFIRLAWIENYAELREGSSHMTLGDLSTNRRMNFAGRTHWSLAPAYSDPPPPDGLPTLTSKTRQGAAVLAEV